MPKTFTEQQINIESLAAHISDSGLTPHEVQPDGIWIRSPKGLGFRISLITDRKFIRFATYLPLNQHATIGQKHELARRLNENVFLPVFTIDPDEDLTVMYVLPFSGGLVPANFMAVVNQFGLMLEYVVQTFNEDRLIHFGAPDGKPADMDLVPASGELLH
ncbi:YbjN domain-containing protein [Ralstonia soli]|uniref:YbjN domain-containing protein n=1 Tax=Ralstonia soli TaxID=2953896 RepID=A0ABT1ASU2_9RALS|nr:YbjN domain-containing protein [Ralstonia soli]MCO5401511.1 YbjN domain-containing protein [Ralstonia soli]